jgi:hypothetical protein
MRRMAAEEFCIQCDASRGWWSISSQRRDRWPHAARIVQEGYSYPNALFLSPDHPCWLTARSSICWCRGKCYITGQVTMLGHCMQFLSSGLSKSLSKRFYEYMFSTTFFLWGIIVVRSEYHFIRCIILSCTKSLSFPHYLTIIQTCTLVDFHEICLLQWLR